MLKIWIYLLAIIWLISGCATINSKEEIVYEDGKLQKFSYLNESKGSLPKQGNDAAFMDAIDTLRRVDPSALPQLADLPSAKTNFHKPPARTYTGVIKNSTKTDVVVPSLNSGGTLVIPAHGFIEYVAYVRNFDLTVYSDGKPFYCLKIAADPKNYQYMCKQYDFIAEIVKPEPTQKYGPGKLKRRIKKKPKSDEEKGVG